MVRIPFIEKIRKRPVPPSARSLRLAELSKGFADRFASLPGISPKQHRRVMDAIVRTGKKHPHEQAYLLLRNGLNWMDGYLYNLSLDENLKKDRNIPKRVLDLEIRCQKMRGRFDRYLDKARYRDAGYLRKRDEGKVMEDYNEARGLLEDVRNLLLRHSDKLGEEYTAYKYGLPTVEHARELERIRKTPGARGKTPLAWNIYAPYIKKGRKP